MLKLQEKLKHKNIILASGSPRRQMLLQELGITFRVEVRKIQEVFPPTIGASKIAEFLSRQKALAFPDSDLSTNTILITADTVVRLENTVVEKPGNRPEAIRALQLLSGKKHIVTTGVCLRSSDRIESFSVDTEVFFKDLQQEEITYYIDNYKPFDKAGAYGIQEWIGYIGIEKINGSFYNVMGLPVKALYDALMAF